MQVDASLDAQCPSSKITATTQHVHDSWKHQKELLPTDFA